MSSTVRGFACGVFDLFHYGHLLMLEDCKKRCTHLTIAVNSCDQIDQEINPNKLPVIFSLEHRMRILQNSRHVDEVISYSSEEELEQIMRQGNFDLRFLGDDYKGKKITADDAIPIEYISRDHGWSTSYFKLLIKDKLR